MKSGNSEIPGNPGTYSHHLLPESSRSPCSPLLRVLLLLWRQPPPLQLMMNSPISNKCVPNTAYSSEYAFWQSQVERMIDSAISRSSYSKL